MPKAVATRPAKSTTVTRLAIAAKNNKTEPSSITIPILPPVLAKKIEFHANTTTSKSDARKLVQSTRSTPAVPVTPIENTTPAHKPASSVVETISLLPTTSVTKSSRYQKKAVNKGGLGKNTSDQSTISLRGVGTSKLKSQQRDLTRKLGYIEAKLLDDPNNIAMISQLDSVKDKLDELNAKFEQIDKLKAIAERLDTKKRKQMIEYDRTKITTKMSKLRTQLELTLVGLEVSEDEVAVRNELADLQEKKLYIVNFPAHLEYIKIAADDGLSPAEITKRHQIWDDILKMVNYTRPTHRMALDWQPTMSANDVKIPSSSTMSDEFDEEPFVDINNDDGAGYDDVWGNSNKNSRRHNDSDDDIESNIQMSYLKRGSAQGDFDGEYAEKKFKQFNKDLNKFKKNSGKNDNNMQSHNTKSNGQKKQFYKKK